MAPTVAGSTVIEINTCPKWWNPTQQDVKDNTSTPYIYFWSIMLAQNLRCNIIGAPNNIRKILSWKGK